MTLRVSGKNLDIGEALRQHVVQKVEATVGRCCNGAVSGYVVVTREGAGYRSDCMLRLSSGISLHAEGRAHEPYLCFDQAAPKSESRPRRHEARLKGDAGASPANARGKVGDYLVEQPGENEEEPAEGLNPIVAAGTEDLSFRSPRQSPNSISLALRSLCSSMRAAAWVNVVYRRDLPARSREPRRAA